MQYYSLVVSNHNVPITSFHTETELMNKFSRSSFADWLETNDMDFLIRPEIKSHEYNIKLKIL